MNLVQDRTRVMNRVHSLLDKYDVKCDYDNIFGVKGTRWLKSLKLVGSSNDSTVILNECIRQIEFLNTEIKNIESKIICKASKSQLPPAKWNILVRENGPPSRCLFGW
jgi:hypothetical protein